jgi:RND superfamily putative drug exporter
MAVVPSLMTLLGKANWWFPRRVDRLLPRVSVEADDLAALPVAPLPDPELV